MTNSQMNSHSARRGNTRRVRGPFSVIPYLFVGAAVVYLLVLMAYPLVNGVWLSLTDTKLLAPARGKFVGAQNYLDALSDGDIVATIVTTLVYTVLSVVGCVVLGTSSAVIVNRWIPARSVLRSILIVPWAVPTVALALVFNWIYNDTDGVSNRMTSALGIGQIGWLTDARYGMLAVVIPTVWKLAPFVMLVVLAALQSVPDEQYEASRVDGSDTLTTFRAIVFPYIAPTIRVIALLMAIWSFRRFEIIWLITGGGPGEATKTVVIDVYRAAFSDSRLLGVGATFGVIGLVLSLLVTLVHFFVEHRASKK